MWVIAGSLVFVAAMLFGLSALATSGGGITAGIAVVILLGSLIPWRAARRMRPGLTAGQHTQEIVAAQALKRWETKPFSEN